MASKKNGAQKKDWDPKRVRTLRLRLSDTQEQFAHRLGVSFMSVSRWETGATAPSGLAKQALDKLDAQTRGGK